HELGLRKALDAEVATRAADLEMHVSRAKGIALGCRAAQILLDQVIDRPGGRAVAQPALQGEAAVGRGARLGACQALDRERWSVCGDRRLSDMPCELGEGAQVWEALGARAACQKRRIVGAVFADAGRIRRMLVGERLCRRGREALACEPANGGKLVEERTRET